MLEEGLVEVLKEVLEDEVEEELQEGVFEDEGLKKQGILVDGIAFEHAGFLHSRSLEIVRSQGGGGCYFVPLVGVRARQDWSQSSTCLLMLHFSLV